MPGCSKGTKRGTTEIIITRNSARAAFWFFNFTGASVKRTAFRAIARLNEALRQPTYTNVLRLCVSSVVMENHGRSKTRTRFASVRGARYIFHATHSRTRKRDFGRAAGGSWILKVHPGRNSVREPWKCTDGERKSLVSTRIVAVTLFSMPFFIFVVSLTFIGKVSRCCQWSVEKPNPKFRQLVTDMDKTWTKIEKYREKCGEVVWPAEEI